MSTITEVETTPQAIEELAGRIFLEGVGALHLGSVYIGVKHGLFVALVEDGPLTARELATRTGLDGWYWPTTTIWQQPALRPHQGSEKRWSTRLARHSSGGCHLRPRRHTR